MQPNSLITEVPLFIACLPDFALCLCSQEELFKSVLILRAV